MNSGEKHADRSVSDARAVDLADLLDGYGAQTESVGGHSSAAAELPRSGFDELVDARTSDEAAAKAERRKLRGDPEHKIRMAPLSDPHGPMRRVYPDWL